MNYPPISTHLTPPWEEEDEWHEVHVDFYVGDEEHTEDLSVLSANTEDSITDALYERLYDIYGDNADIEITHLSID